MAYRTLSELVEAGRAAIRAEREAADAWLRNQPQREAQAAAAFINYMKKQHDVLIDPDDTPVYAYEYLSQLMDGDEGAIAALLDSIIAEHRDRWQDCMTGQRKHIAACRIAHLRYQARQQTRRA